MPTPLEIKTNVYTYCNKTEAHCLCPKCPKVTKCKLHLCEGCRPNSGSSKTSCKHNPPPMKDFDIIIREWGKNYLLKEKTK